MDPLIITVAVTGAEVTKEDNPNLPITPAEIAEEVYKCYLAGASIAHIHGRDANGGSTQDTFVYAEIVREIRNKCDIIIQVSTGGAIGMIIEERQGPLELDVEMATLTTGTVNFGNGIFMNSKEDYMYLYEVMKLHNIKPEFEIFDIGMIENAKRIIQKDEKLTEHSHFDFVMGVPGAIPANINNLNLMINSLPPYSTWTVAGVGRNQLQMNTFAIALGGHVRVGFEDNIYYRKGQLAKSNSEFVERIVRIAKELERPIASVDEARKILKLHKED